MAPTSIPAVMSGNSDTYSPEIADTLQFEEEIQSLVASTAAPPGFNSPPASGSSFTALLGLPPSRAVELLHDREPPPPLSPSSVSPVGDIWRFPLTCSPIFPSNPILVERASRFSVFAAEDPTEAGSISGDHAMKVELPEFQIPVQRPQQKRSTGKRNNGETSKAKCPGKKGKSGAEDNGTGGDDKLPYVHVRARRGQATDSHSLAERARREKINARMKLLQDLVPGCDKISGTALVLDEIINHVQSLQRQVEFLSMRLSAVNPRIDFSSLDSILSAECVRLMSGDGNGTVGPDQPAWSAEGTSNVDKQMWQGDLVQQQWERDELTHSHHKQHGFIGKPGSSLFTSYDSTGSVTTLPNQLKAEL